VTGTIESITSLPGNYYTVNPQAVNETLDVLTGNRRDVCIMQVAIGTSGKTAPVAVVAVGALLVGSVHWSHKVGEVARKGEDLGTTFCSSEYTTSDLTRRLVPIWRKYGHRSLP
jgi:phosphatidylserine decarboxylase